MATFPSFVKFQTLNNTASINTIQNVEAISGIQSVVQGDQIKQIIQCTTIPLTVAEDRMFQLFLKEIKGAGAFNFDLSDHLEFKRIITTPEIAPAIAVDNSSGYSIGDSTLTVDSNTHLVLGSYIQFTNHHKIYQILNRTATSITITPNLYEAVPDDTQINYSNLNGRFRIISGGEGIDQTQIIDRKAYGFTLIEEISN